LKDKLAQQTHKNNKTGAEVVLETRHMVLETANMVLETGNIIMEAAFWTKIVFETVLETVEGVKRACPKLSWRSWDRLGPLLAAFGAALGRPTPPPVAVGEGPGGYCEGFLPMST